VTVRLSIQRMSLSFFLSPEHQGCLKGEPANFLIMGFES
jgi:hypothetical protein